MHLKIRKETWNHNGNEEMQTAWKKSGKGIKLLLLKWDKKKHQCVEKLRFWNILVKCLENVTKVKWKSLFGILVHGHVTHERDLRIEFILRIYLIEFTGVLCDTFCDTAACDPNNSIVSYSSLLRLKMSFHISINNFAELSTLCCCCSDQQNFYFILQNF